MYQKQGVALFAGAQIAARSTSWHAGLPQEVLLYHPNGKGDWQ